MYHTPVAAVYMMSNDLPESDEGLRYVGVDGSRVYDRAHLVELNKPETCDNFNLSSGLIFFFFSNADKEGIAPTFPLPTSAQQL